MNGATTSVKKKSASQGDLTALLNAKILKGAKPAHIPVEMNSQIQFIINLKTAKALGLTIAPEVLYQADRIIR